MLYLLQSEIKGISPETVFSKKNAPDKSESGKDNDELPENNTPVLNFENIFSEELENGPENKQASGKSVHSQTDRISSKADRNNSNLQTGKKRTPYETDKEKHYGDKVRAVQNESELWELFLKYLELEHQSAKTKTELEKTKTKLNHCFGEIKTDSLVLDRGTLKRIREKDGSTRWELATTM